MRTTKDNIQETTDVDSGIGQAHKLILFNDNENSFDHVIVSLMELCGHSFTQSEQLAMLVHYKGQATVKTFEDEIECIQLCSALRNRNLDARTN